MNKINLNDYIFVKLNNKGKRIIDNHPIHSEFAKPNNEGFYKFQMWDFMKVFGHYLNMGLEAISEGNCIYFNEEDLRKG